MFLIVAVRQHALGRRGGGQHSNISDTGDPDGHADMCPVPQLLGFIRKDVK